jgi:hypothetical protein
MRSSPALRNSVSKRSVPHPARAQYDRRGVADVVHRDLVAQRARAKAADGTVGIDHRAAPRKPRTAPRQHRRAFRKQRKIARAGIVAAIEIVALVQRIQRMGQMVGMPDVVTVQKRNDIRAAIGPEPVKRGVARSPRPGIGLLDKRHIVGVEEIRRRRAGGSVIDKVDMDPHRIGKLLAPHAVERAPQDTRIALVIGNNDRDVARLQMLSWLIWRPVSHRLRR